MSSPTSVLPAPGGRATQARRLPALQAGGATPAPPVGTALGPHGVNIIDFCKAYNAQTESMRGIAQTKLPDLNANDIDAAMKIVEGTARSMGVTTEGN